MRAVRLEASNEVLFYPDDSCEDHVLVQLLTEAYERGFQNRLILARVKERDQRFSEWGMDHTYKYPLRRFSYRVLEETWKQIPGAGCYDIFTPENEDVRSGIEIEGIAQKARMPVMMGLGMKLMGEYYEKLRKAAEDPFYKIRKQAA